MSKVTNPFKEGQVVVCISEDFPRIEKYGGIEQKNIVTPKIGDEMPVDEILGDFLRFDYFDTEASNNWWHWTRFELLKINI